MTTTFKQPKYLIDYPRMMLDLEGEPTWKQREVCRDLCKTDMYFLLRYGCHVPAYILDRPFSVTRCAEADVRLALPEGLHNLLTMVFRFGFKSTILDYGALIQRILTYPEDAFCIFSFNQTVAETHLKPIKETLEKSKELINWFPEILYPKPPNQNWSMSGITVQRDSTRLEPTLMASGLVSGLPIGLHFNGACYDDVVTRDSVKTGYSIKDTTAAFRNSLSLSMRLPGIRREVWLLGTFYRYGDTYCVLINDGVYELIKIPWINTRKEVWYDTQPGDYIIHNPQEAEGIKASFGRHETNTQMMLEPVPAEDRTFDWNLIKDNMFDPVEFNYDTLKMSLMSDVATLKKEKRGHEHDRTALVVVGQDKFGHKFWVDGICDRLSRPQAVDEGFRLSKKWGIQYWSWEEVAAQEDLFWIKREIARRGLHHIKVVSFKPRGEKQDRIEGALLAPFESGEFRIPTKMGYKTKDGLVIDLVNELRKELKEHPYGEFDDLADVLAQHNTLPDYGHLRKAFTRGADPLYARFVKKQSSKGIRNYL